MRELHEREALLDRIRGYVDRRGLASLTVEGLARDLGMEAATLREFFDTKEEIAIALIARDRIRQRRAFAEVDSDPYSSRTERGRHLWRFSLEHEGDSRLLFESFALGLRDERYRACVHGVDDWLEMTEAALLRDGYPREQAIAFATLALAVHRGAMMDVCATGERARVNAAMELWFAAAAPEADKP